MLSLSDFSPLRVGGLVLCMLDVATYLFIVNQASLRKRRILVALQQQATPEQQQENMGPLRDDAVMEELLGWVYAYRHRADSSTAAISRDAAGPPTTIDTQTTASTNSQINNNGWSGTYRYYRGSRSRGKKTKKLRDLPTVLEDTDIHSLPDLEQARAQRTMLVGFRSFEL
jgi:hypothetical protein